MQPANAYLPIEVTLSGMINVPSTSLLNLINELHPLNALSPMVVAVSGMVTLSRKLQFWNAYEGMVVCTVMVTFLIL